jgi:hypothetical protein
MNIILKNFFDSLLALGRKTKPGEISQKILSSVAQTATVLSLLLMLIPLFFFATKKPRSSLVIQSKN